MPANDQRDFLSAEVIEDPYPFYSWLRQHEPVHEVGDTGVFLVSQRALIEEALEREADFSANLTGVLIRNTDGSAGVFDLAAFGGRVDAIANADEPSHSVHRRLILPHVTPKRIGSLEDLFRRWAGELMAPLLEAGAGDWIANVANPLPARATAVIAGLPVEDSDRLLEWAMTGTEILAGTTLERMGVIAKKTLHLSDYLRAHVTRAIAEPASGPAPGIVGELARGVRQGLISEGDAVSILVVLVGAGGESTSSLTGSAVRLLAQDAALQQELRADPSLVPAFVEEAVRLESPFRGHYRAVTGRTQLGGIALPPGSRLFLLWAAANRDPALFVEPDRVDLGRPNARDHLAFGRGTHFCVGARLARLEARVIIEELLARTSDLSLDPDLPPRYAPSLFVRRYDELHIVTA